LVPLLQAQGHQVVGLDSGYFDECLLTPITNDFKQITKDIRDVVKSDLDNIDAVIHLAGLSNDPLGELAPGITEEINLGGAMKLALLAKAGGVKRFIYSSSQSMSKSRTCDLELIAAGVAAATLGKQSIAGILSLALALGKQSKVSSCLSLILESTLLLEGNHVALALEHLWCHQTLDLGRLCVLLAILGGNLPADNTLADIISGVKAPKLANLVSPLRPEAQILVCVG
jgi:hypothetical protein